MRFGELDISSKKVLSPTGTLEKPKESRASASPVVKSKFSFQQRPASLIHYETPRAVMITGGTEDDFILQSEHKEQESAVKISKM